MQSGRQTREPGPEGRPHGRAARAGPPVQLGAETSCLRRAAPVRRGSQRQTHQKGRHLAWTPQRELWHLNLTLGPGH